MLKSYPLNIPKVQSKGSKISNLGQKFIFTENCTPIHMNHFSYPPNYCPNQYLCKAPKYLSQSKSLTPNYRASPPVFLTIEYPPWDNFWSHYIFDPLDQASLICFEDISLNLVKEKYLKTIF